MTQSRDEAHAVDHRRTILIAMALMLIAGILATIIHLCVRIVSPRYPAVQIVFLRTFFTVLLTAPLVFRPGQRAWRTNAPGLQLLRGVIGVCSMTTWYYALGRLPLGDAGVLSMTTAIFVTIGAAVWLGERVDAWRWLAVIIGLLGALIVLQPNPAAWSLPAMMALLASVLWAMSLLMAKYLARYDQSLTISFYQVLTIAPIAGLCAISGWVWPSREDLMIFILMGFVAGCANYGAIHALRLADASLLMPAEYAKIIWMTLWGYLFFSEIPGLNVWAGALLIGAATAVITWRERQRPTTIETGKQVT